MDIINTILDSISTVWDFVITIKDILFTFVTFIPNPFRLVVVGFITLWFIIFVWKFSKGGS